MTRLTGRRETFIRPDLLFVTRRSDINSPLLTSLLQINVTIEVRSGALPQCHGSRSTIDAFSCHYGFAFLPLIISWWTVTAYVYNTVYSELTACNTTLTRWLQHRYEQKPLHCASRNNDHVSHRHPNIQLPYIAYSVGCWWHHEIRKLHHSPQCIMLVTLAL